MGIFDRIKKLFKSEEETKSLEIEKAKTILPIGEKITETKSSRSSTISKLMQVFKGQISREEEIRLAKQDSLEELVDKLCLQLAEFWGIPKSEVTIPRVQILSKEELKRRGREEIKIASSVYTSEGGFIFVNEEYLAEEFQDEFINIKSVLAEEVCHHLENVVKAHEGLGAGEEYIAEFFGMISSLYISEQLPSFRDKYQEYLRLAANFSEEKKTFNATLDKIKQEEENIYKNKMQSKTLIEKEMIELEEDKRAVKDWKVHLAYYPAAAYYYEIIKLKPEVRYQLLKRSPQAILDYIIQPAEEKLDVIKSKIVERKERLERQVDTELTPSLKKTFELKCSECGKLFGSEAEFYKHPCAKKIIVKCPVCGSEEIEDIE
jgi:RNase P subunit RPR2